MICFLLTICLTITSQTAIPQYDGSVAKFDVPAITLLAHNYQSGRTFDDIQVGDSLRYQYEQGNWQTYQVRDVLIFQALSPDSERSDLMAPDGTIYTPKQIHELLYNHPEYLILQTCIYRDGNLNWGRLFVVATKRKGNEYARRDPQ